MPYSKIELISCSTRQAVSIWAMDDIAEARASALSLRASAKGVTLRAFMSAAETSFTHR